MPRILGVDIPNDKRTFFSLQYIYGIGPYLAEVLCQRTGVDPAKQARDLTEDELVELGMPCAVSLGVGRLTATWDVTDDVPEAFRSGGDHVTPWASSGVIASG